jgi:hypothetical protein
MAEREAHLIGSLGAAAEHAQWNSCKNQQQITQDGTVDIPARRLVEALHPFVPCLVAVIL